MSDPFFFGYGSLVNRGTHDYPEAHRATVKGWRRLWRHTSLRKVVYLTVHEAPGHQINGLIAAVPNADWATLDERERAYDRFSLSEDIIDHSHPASPDVQMYKVRSEYDMPPSADHPILLSYLDTVVKGYLDEFGLEGAKAFFDTTDGWSLPILDDRSDPVYPRAVPLSRTEKAFVTNNLADFGATLMSDEHPGDWV